MAAIKPSFGQGGHGLGYERTQAEEAKKAYEDALPGFGGVKWDSRIYGAAPNQQDPRADQAVEAQKGIADDFLRNENRYRDNAVRDAEKESLENTKGSLQTVRRKANAKGLLYSGTREGLEGDATNAGYRDLIESRAAANTKVSQTKDALTQAPIDTKYGLAQAAISGQGGAINTNLQVADLIETQRMNRQQALDELIGGLGMVGGYAAGAKDWSKKTPGVGAMPSEDLGRTYGKGY